MNFKYNEGEKKKKHKIKAVAELEKTKQPFKLEKVSLLLLRKQLANTL